MDVAAASTAQQPISSDTWCDVKRQPSHPVPMHLRNAPTKLMKELGAGREYRYAHDEDNAYAAGENYLPDELANKQYYFPTQNGLEKQIAEKLEYLRSLDHLAQQSKTKDIIGKFGLDRNNNGEFEYGKEPMILYKIDLESKRLVDMVKETQIIQLQKLLEGR